MDTQKACVLSNNNPQSEDEYVEIFEGNGEIVAHY
jgi:hypothetical protein